MAGMTMRVIHTRFLPLAIFFKHLVYGRGDLANGFSFVFFPEGTFRKFQKGRKYFQKKKHIYPDVN